MRTREGFVSSVPPFDTRADAFTTEMMRPVHPPRRYLAIAAALALASNGTEPSDQSLESASGEVW